MTHTHARTCAHTHTHTYKSQMNVYPTWTNVRTEESALIGLMALNVTVQEQTILVLIVMLNPQV